MQVPTLAGALVAGVYLALLGSWPWRVSPSLLALSAALIGVFWLRRWPLLLPLGLSLFALGLARGGQVSPLESPLANYYQRSSLQFQGVIVDDPQSRGLGARFKFQVQRVGSGNQWEEVEEVVLVWANPAPKLIPLREAPYFRYGDTLLVVGKLEQPASFSAFDYQDYLARQGISYVLYYPKATLLAEGGGSFLLERVYSWRFRLATSLAKAVPEPQASLGQALLLGLRGDMPEEMREAFVRSGASHLLAISGLHVGVLLGIVVAFSGWLLGRRRQRYLLLPLVILWLYALISGMSPSVQRAAIMGSAYILALALGRPGSGAVALALTAAMMVGWSPRLLLDLSFQLSFTAMAGLVFILPVFDGLLRRYRPQALEGSGLPRVLLRGAALSLEASLAATLATLPLVAFYFHRVSWVGALATLFSLPALSGILVTAFLAALAGTVAPVVATVFGWFFWIWASYLLVVVRLFAAFPSATINVSLGGLLVWAYYGIGAILLALGPKVFARLLSRPFSAREVAQHLLGRPLLNTRSYWRLMLALALVTLLVWIKALTLPDGQLHVTFLDVGQGDAIFIQTPRGHQILVDGGPQGRTMSQKLGQRMPFWDRTLDLVVLTHPHDDHIQGLLEVVKRYEVGTVLHHPVEYSSAANEEWLKLIPKAPGKVVTASYGQEVRFEDGVALRVLNPTVPPLFKTSSDVDNNAVVLLVTFGQASFLLTADIYREAEAYIISREPELKASVLKVAHHGSRFATTAQFLDRVSPGVAVISVGDENSFGHPHPETLEALLRRLPKERLLLTSESGDVEFVSNGRDLKVVTKP